MPTYQDHCLGEKTSRYFGEGNSGLCILLRVARIEAAVVIVWAYVQELAAGGVSEPARACLLDEMESVQDFMALSPEERMAVYSKIEVLRARAIGSGA
jgi:hypothetical protein